MSKRYIGLILDYMDKHSDKSVVNAILSSKKRLIRDKEADARGGLLRMSRW